MLIKSNKKKINIIQNTIRKNNKNRYEGRFLIVFYQTEFKPIVSTNHQLLMSNF